MSVPAQKRKLSNTQFLWEIYQFAIHISEICVNMPKKYRANYADFIIKSTLEALQYAQMANSIFLSKATTEDAFNERELNLQRAKGLIENVATTADIFLELSRKFDGASPEKIIKNQEYIGEATGKIVQLLDGVMKSDKKRYKEYKK